jgi:hypothetical protein
MLTSFWSRRAEGPDSMMEVEKSGGGREAGGDRG